MIRRALVIIVLVALGACRRQPEGGATPARSQAEQPGIAAAPATSVAPDDSPSPYRHVHILEHELDPWLAEEIHAQEPQSDGWTSEVFVAAANRSLAELGRKLADKGTIPLNIQTPDAQAAVVVDDRLTHQFTDGGIDVSTWDATKDPPLPAAALLEGLRSFVLPRTDSSCRLECEIHDVYPEDENRVNTAVLAFAVSRSDERIIQTNGRWRVAWQWSEGDDLAVITSVATDSLWRATVTGDLFTDCTTSVFRSCPAFSRQLAYGPEHWLACIDRIARIDISGRSGLAVGDVDGDGIDDLYVAQNGGLPNLLLKHNPDGTVTDIAPDAGVDFLDRTAGVLIVDIDNDGHEDVLAAIGDNVLVLGNDGRNHFVARASLRAPDPTIIYMLTAVDFDNDGDLDVYACRYHDTTGGMRVPIPYHDANNGPSNIMWRNDGDLVFTDVTLATGLDVNNRRYSFAASWEDYDGDGDQDLYVANDFGRNNLYRNDGGTFSDVAEQAGAEDMAAGMGVTWSDCDQDGDMDLYVSNMYTPVGTRVSRQAGFMPHADQEHRQAYERHARGNTLLTNAGDGTFLDTTESAGVARGHWAWGALFVDFNSDGLDDLYVPNGFITSGGVGSDLQSYFWRRVVQASSSDPRAADAYANRWSAIAYLLRQGSSWAGSERNISYLNCGDGRFVDVSALTGLDYQEDGRAVAAVDWDGDLDLDMWIMNRTGPQLRFARNNHDDPDHAVALRLVGVQANRDAIGARVELSAGPRRWSKTVRAGSGFVSQSSKWLHFGLGDATVASNVVVFWPGGGRQPLGDLRAGRRYIVEEGSSPEERAADPPLSPLGKGGNKGGPRGLKSAAPPDTPCTDPAPGVRTALLERLTVPPLETMDSAGRAETLKPGTRGPLLVVAWSGQSQYGRQLLTALAQWRTAESEDSFEVVAVCADRGAELENSSAWAESLEAAMIHAAASTRALATLLLLKRAVLFAPMDELTLPTSYLIDSAGKLAVIYEGPIRYEQLAADVAALHEPGADLAGFHGRWMHRPHRDLATLARPFAEVGLVEAARMYIAESREQERRP